MLFRITGLSPCPFRHLFGQSDVKLSALGVERHVADASPGYPDRIELRDAQPGESVLLLNYLHQPARTAYRSSHAIYVLEGARKRYDRIDDIPEALCSRLISLRGFSGAGQMQEADIGPGDSLEPLIDRMFANPTVSYIHAHYAKPGCFAARIDRVVSA
ncbi:MAG: DUF1203 domain-containing protein [Chromatiales bacterium]|jgi:hypothetical protein|nr:DUF1203 domain-containing protein [Chromatiales bacterium]MDH4031912.1 DUF1203 domain-containing protein [Chromatiales bacterium]